MTMCNFWLKKKSRRCGLQPRKGSDYCADHSNPTDRTTCPYGPPQYLYFDFSHVPTRTFEKHLTRCTFRPQTQPFYYSKDINYGPNLDAGSGTVEIVTDSVDWTRLLDKIDRVYQKVAVSIRNSVKTLDESHKHNAQLVSILENLKSLHLLDENTAIAEFGCGKATLSSFISQTLNTNFWLIDRKSFKHKQDHLIPNRTRLKIDIKDLDLKQLQIGDLVAVSKHLCGSATDLTIKCLEHVKSNVKGVFIALCCHHLCDFSTFINSEFLSETEIDAVEFECIKKVTSWAVNGRSVAGDSHWSGKTFSERQELGFKAKRILDFGRFYYLKNVLELDAELIYYCDQSTTLENVALVGLASSL